MESKHEGLCDARDAGPRVSRRGVLKTMAIAAAAGGLGVTTTMFGEAVQQASWGGSRGGNVLVVISLRGGIDGLGVTIPHGDPVYYQQRPNISIPKEMLLVPDEFFGLHPGLAPLQWAFKSGELAAVHAVGLPVPNRSHFSAVEEVEDAAPGGSVRSGWLNRMIGLTREHGPVDGIQLLRSTLPLSLSGIAPTIAVDRIDELALVGAENTDALSAHRKAALKIMWSASSQSELTRGYQASIAATDRFAHVTQTAYEPNVHYPREWPAIDLSDALRDTARLVKADLGIQVISIDFGSWDMHTNYGSVGSGNMRNMIASFARTLDAFLRDLGSHRGRVTVFTISEFGRRIHENGSRGLDHGWGNMMLVAGAGVKGGKYYAKWPGLGSGADDDLAVTTDYRQVLGEVIRSRFPERSLPKVFPGFVVDSTGLGLMR